jgi:hypothetical protein
LCEELKEKRCAECENWEKKRMSKGQRRKRKKKRRLSVTKHVSRMVEISVTMTQQNIQYP